MEGRMIVLPFCFSMRRRSMIGKVSHGVHFDAAYRLAIATLASSASYSL